MLPTFTPVTREDINQVQKLAAIIWNEYYIDIISQDQIVYMLEKMYSCETIIHELDSHYYWFLIKIADTPAGFLSYHKEVSDRIKLDKIYLLKEYRKQGTGNVAIAFVKGAASGLGAHTIYLQVNKKNTQAIEAYQKAGFTIKTDSVTDIGNGFVMDDYIMELNIPFIFD